MSETLENTPEKLKIGEKVWIIDPYTDFIDACEIIAMEKLDMRMETMPLDDTVDIPYVRLHLEKGGTTSRLHENVFISEEDAIEYLKNRDKILEKEGEFMYHTPIHDNRMVKIVVEKNAEEFGIDLNEA